MKNKIKIFVIISLIVTGISCDDYLERSPLDRPSDVNFLSNESELELAVNGAYNSLLYRFRAIPFYLWLDCYSDIGWDRGGAGNRYARGNFDPQSALFSDVWSSFYVGIGRCNYILSNMDRSIGNISEDRFSSLRGEILFLRSYLYMNLAMLYGDVPLITKESTLEDAFVSRTDKMEVLRFVMNDLNEARDLLPMEHASSESGRATKGAALGLLTRVALYSEDWDKVIEASNELFSLNKYELFPDYQGLFTYQGEGSNEVIFDIQYHIEVEMWNSSTLYSRNASGFINKIPLLSLIDRYECTDGLRIDQSPLYDPANPFQNRDPRLHQSIALPGSIWLGYQYEIHPDSTECWNYNTNPATRVNNRDVTNAFASFSGYGWRKYADEIDVELQSSELNFIMIRYAEVLLNYAEAKIEVNDIDNSVYDAINEVRQRQSVQMPHITQGKTQDELRQLLRRERVSELSGEGLRFFDIRRWRIAEDVLNETVYGRIIDGGYELQGIPVFDENGHPHYDSYSDIFSVIETRSFNPERDYLWPIPQNDLDVNSNLSQNLGY